MQFHNALFHIAPGIVYMTADIDLTAALRLLTKREIEDLVPAHTFGCAEKRSRFKLEEAAHLLPPYHRALLADMAMSKRRRKEDQEREPRVDPDPPIQSTSDSQFFQTVSEERRQECISHFINAAGSHVLCPASCAV